VTYTSTQLLVSDIADPIGVFDLSNEIGFLIAIAAGCP